MMTNRHLAGAVAVLASAALFSGAAHAASVCSTSDVTPTALACEGFDTGNVLSNSPTDIATQTSELALLGFNWNGDWSSVTHTAVTGQDTIKFKNPLVGINYVGIHFSNATGGSIDGTGFYKIDAGAGLSSLGVNLIGGANTVLYVFSAGGAVPEPGVWLMMLLGVGGIGGMLRVQRKGLRLA